MIVPIQIMGLNDWALALVLNHSVKKEEHSRINGLNEVEYVLYQYELDDGRVVHEVVHETKWHDGPVYYLALKQGDQFLFDSFWTDFPPEGLPKPHLSV